MTASGAMALTAMELAVITVILAADAYRGGWWLLLWAPAVVSAGATYCAAAWSRTYRRRGLTGRH